MAKNRFAATIMVAAGRSRILSLCLKPLSRRTPPDDGAKWDAQYTAGKWDFIDTLPQVGHYYIIASYYASLTPGGSILDVGCGTGVLQRVLRQVGYERYVGIDISQVAIQQASRNSDGRTSFEVIQNGRFESPGPFSTIIFNETLYYLDDPLAALREHATQLTGDGVFLVSIGYARSLRDRLYKQQIWQAIEREYTVVHETFLSEATLGLSWHVKALKPRAGRST
jgi:SAM-dependent methyltransferase